MRFLQSCRQLARLATLLQGWPPPRYLSCGSCLSPAESFPIAPQRQQAPFRSIQGRHASKRPRRRDDGQTVATVFACVEWNVIGALGCPIHLLPSPWLRVTLLRAYIIRRREQESKRLTVPRTARRAMACNFFNGYGKSVSLVLSNTSSYAYSMHSASTYNIICIYHVCLQY